MKNNYLVIVISFFVLSAASCSKDLEKVNQNPNATSDPQPDYLLTAAQKITSDLYWGADNNFNSSELIVQHWAKIQYTEPDRYVFSNSSFVSLWNTGYAQGITDLNTIIQSADEKANASYKSVATILRSWVFTLLTDNYGNIPYTQAGNIKEFLTPKYDSQKTVYFGLLDELKAASADLEAASETITGDVIYNGDLNKWRKLANALRFRIALRIADREPEKAKAVIAELTADPGVLINSNEESAKFTYTTSPQQNPVSAWFDTRDDYRISNTLVTVLKDLNDPRLAVYASKPTDQSVTDYVGVPNGLTNSDASNLGFARTSKPGSYFLTPQSPSVIVSYAEILFDRAEAAARGFTNENAASLYNAGITASLNQFGITDDLVITQYLGQLSVAYDAADFKKSIGTQKWIALFGQGLEAFAEWRRLDYPKLSPGNASVLEGKIPSRFIYPGTEQALNGDNYAQAVGDQGEDNLVTKLWFDVN